MTVTPEQIGWGKYAAYEGPYFKGSQKYKLPDNPDELDKQLAVITACESGHYDAINCYDSAICSAGLIQWTEINQFNVSNLLGEVIEKYGAETVMPHLKPALELTNSAFKKNDQGKWRFKFLDARGDVINAEKTRELFLGCSGKKDDWTPETVSRAKLWASCLANALAQPTAQVVQDEFTRNRLKWFVMPEARAILFGDDAPADQLWVGALRAAFISFAINRQADANSMVKSASEVLTCKKWSPEWCTLVIKRMTFGPKIAIYSTRYDSIRPVIEKLWGISLPKNAALLSKYTLEKAESEPVTVQEAPEPPTENTKTEIEVSPPLTPKINPVTVPVPEPKGIFGFFLWIFSTVFDRKKK